MAPYVPVIDRTRQRDGFFDRSACRYDRETDAYRCPADKPLGYIGTVQASQVRRYAAARPTAPDARSGRNARPPGNVPLPASSTRTPATRSARLPKQMRTSARADGESGSNACSGTSNATSSSEPSN